MKMTIMHQKSTSLASMASPPLYVFVYGTLRRGQVNDINRLQPAPRWIGQGCIQGTLVDLGWYPGLLLQGQTPVQGEVYEVMPTLLAHLDEIEGLLPTPNGEYVRREVSVLCDTGLLACWVYEVTPSFAQGRTPIMASDWVTWYTSARG